MKLSKQQKAAVAHLGSPALVVAGAGSGKTRTLTAKIQHLISIGYDPKRILAITFTNKAADEMKTRLIQMTGLSTNDFPWVRTYHSASYKILQRHCTELGYHSPLQIYATYQQQKTIKEILIKLDYDKKYTSAVLSGISNAKNFGDPMAYFDSHPKVSIVRLADVYNLYEKELKNKNAVDFDNILALTRDLLRDNLKIRDKYRSWFQYVLCDEYQDANNLNEELTRLLLSNGNFFAVGDDWQSIYSFRMSNIDHFLSFSEKYQGAKIFRLEENFRSADKIVKIGNDLIGYNDNKMDKQCFSAKKGGIAELHDFYDEYEEATWVQRKIQNFRQMGMPCDKIAVLYRTKFSSLAFEKAFRSAGIPYRMLGGKGFFERKEILDVTCYLTAATFPKDDVAFDRIINTPKRGIGPGALSKINHFRSSDMSLQDAARKSLREKVLPAKIYDGVSLVINLLDDIRDMTPDTAIREVLTRTGYMDYLKQYLKASAMDYTAREENIEQLIHSAGLKNTIPDYLEEAALIREDKADDDENSGTGVNLSTIHASKGLEYSVVFIVACEENLFPHWRSMETPTGLEEERRLMYVAVTRAEQYLFLSSADFRKGQYNQPSRFLDEISESL